MARTDTLFHGLTEDIDAGIQISITTWHGEPRSSCVPLRIPQSILDAGLGVSPVELSVKALFLVSPMVFYLDNPKYIIFSLPFLSLLLLNPVRSFSLFAGSL
jgi:hypothetical protein